LTAVTRDFARLVGLSTSASGCKEVKMTFKPGDEVVVKVLPYYGSKGTVIRTGIETVVVKIDGRGLLTLYPDVLGRPPILGA
jgi:archaellin